jgi:hypothetical protein
MCRCGLQLPGNAPAQKAAHLAVQPGWQHAVISHWDLDGEQFDQQG